MADARKPGLFRRLTSALFEEVDGKAEADKPAATIEVVDDDPFNIEAGLGQAPTKQMQVSGSQARFEARMRELLETQRTGAAGKLQLVGLEAIKQKMGDRWDEIADKARRIAESVIERRLAPGDVFAPYETDGFLVLFVDLSEEQARFKATAIAQEIHDLLMGEIGSNTQWVQAFAASFVNLIPENQRPARLADLDGMLAAQPPLAVSTVSFEKLTNLATATTATPDEPEMRPISRSLAEVGAAQAQLEARLQQVMTETKPTIVGKTQFIDLDKIKQQFGERWEEVAAKARVIATSIIEARIAPSDVYAPVDADSFLILFAELDEEQARLKVTAIAREIYEKLLGELGLGPEHMPESFVAELAAMYPPIATPAEPEKKIADVDIGTPLVNKIAEAIVKTEVIKPPERTAGLDSELQRRLGELVIGFRPTWFAPKAVLSVYDARVMRLDAQQRMQFGAGAYPHNDPPVVFEMDRAVLRAAILGLRQLVQRKLVALVQAPIHLQSLSAHSSGLLIDLCRAIHPELRKLLVIEIAGLVNNKPNPRLTESIAELRPFCREVALRVQLGFTDFDYAARQRIVRVGVDLEDTTDPALASGNVGQQFARFTQQAQQHKLHSHLYGLAKPDIARQAQIAGFHYLNGPAVARVVRAPNRVVAFKPAF